MAEREMLAQRFQMNGHMIIFETEASAEIKAYDRWRSMKRQVIDANHGDSEGEATSAKVTTLQTPNAATNNT